ncbi:uncharacterized protein LOC115327024 [Ixodes scapularis]|uniref:uncharacterized protein LOC115327024 n=1 Tax=Ixodes scapularis TaxID=6945 RepID=UPI001A9D09EB|nr:uncharacterized protein LOC115327024 [Ixodes scapularis]
MGAILISLVAITAFLTPRCSSNSPPYPELNPALGKYQDASTVLPIQETWYSVYRNYENDPAFGDVLCPRFSSQGPEVNGSYPLLWQSVESSVQLTVTPSSSEGYTAKNVLHFQAIGQSVSLLVYVAYLDAHECTVFRNIYASDEACSLLVPESALARNKTCCDFVFDLLCGTGQKYYSFNESCLN